MCVNCSQELVLKNKTMICLRCNSELLTESEKKIVEQRKWASQFYSGYEP